jgi:hypothetical protein
VHDSSVDLAGTAGEATGSKKKAVDTLFETLNAATNQMKEMQQQANDRKKAAVATQDSDTTTKQWAEYSQFVDRFTDIVGVPAKLPLFRLLAIRIRKLERLLGISDNDSALLGVHGIPTEVVTTSSSGRDTESDL